MFRAVDIQTFNSHRSNDHDILENSLLWHGGGLFDYVQSHWLRLGLSQKLELLTAQRQHVLATRAQHTDRIRAMVPEHEELSNEIRAKVLGPAAALVPLTRRVQDLHREILVSNQWRAYTDRQLVAIDKAVLDMRADHRTQG